MRRAGRAAGGVGGARWAGGAGRPGRPDAAARPGPAAPRREAWAAGTPVLLLQVLLGLRPDRARHALETLAPPELPSWVGRSLRLTGVRAFDRQWDVRVEDSRVTVEEA